MLQNRPSIRYAIILALLCTIIFIRPALTDTILHVAPDGNDSWTGSSAIPNESGTDGPLASLAGARDAVRRIRAEHRDTGVIRVVVSNGVYQLSEPFVLEPQDSGTGSSPVVYEAAKGAHPVFSGGRSIGGWKKSGKGLWKTTVPKGWNFSQLFINGERRTRARTPDKGYFRAEGRVPVSPKPQFGDWRDFDTLAFRFRKGDIKDWAERNDINVVTLHFWESCRMRIASVDTANDIVRFTGGKNFAGWMVQNSRPFYYVENLREALDAPGEWYLDRKTGELWYKPLPNEDIRTAKAIAPAVNRFIELKGDPENGRFIEHVTFRGLAFRYADWQLEPDGHTDIQAAVGVEAVVMGDGVRNCAFEQCEVSHIGTCGIWLRKGCTDNRIDQCEIADTGAGGIRIGEEKLSAIELCRTFGNTVNNSYIHDGGHIYPGAVALWIGDSPSNTITHNEICDHQYTGISLGWSWGYNAGGDTSNTRIEYNHIHHLGQGILYDMGGVYALGTSPDRVVSHNLIHDVYGGGIYPDEGSTQMTIEGNIIYRCLRGAIVINYGAENMIRNNILAFSNLQQFYRNIPENHPSFIFENNIVYYKTGRLFQVNNDGMKERYDNNIYWNAAGQPVTFPNGLSFSEWQAKGKDKNSIIADPGFVNPAKDDFRLTSKSPAFKMGFRATDPSTIGLMGKPEWVNRPKRIARPEFDLKYFLFTAPLHIETGFEDLLPGSTTLDAETLGESSEASVRVTDEDAASGLHSLKFIDAPGMAAEFNPHLVYHPYLYKGIAGCSFKLKLGAGTKFLHEWRDNDYPYNTGPSIRIDADGKLRLSGAEYIDIPRDQWIGIDVTCKLGKQADGTYDVKVTLPGGKQVAFDKVPCAKHFNRLDYLAFISNATEHTIFYIDDLVIGGK